MLFSTTRTEKLRRGPALRGARWQAGRSGCHRRLCHFIAISAAGLGDAAAASVTREIGELLSPVVTLPPPPRVLGVLRMLPSPEAVRRGQA